MPVEPTSGYQSGPQGIKFSSKVMCPKSWSHWWIVGAPTVSNVCVMWNWIQCQLRSFVLTTKLEWLTSVISLACGSTVKRTQKSPAVQVLNEPNQGWVSSRRNGCTNGVQNLLVRWSTNHGVQIGQMLLFDNLQIKIITILSSFCVYWINLLSQSLAAHNTPQSPYCSHP